MPPLKLPLPPLKPQTHIPHMPHYPPLQPLLRSLSHSLKTKNMSSVNLKPNTTTKSKLKGIVFDMDGTLTVPVIDFQAMYKSVLGEDEYIRIKKSSPSGIDILHLIEKWAPDKQLKAYEIIADYEQQGMDKLQIMPGIVFDMDGTLTVPVIDFQAMYKSVLGEDEYIRIKKSSPSGIDILHLIEKWAPDKQLRAYQIIADYEQQGMDKLQIMPGAAELCGFLNSRNIRRGLITRNVKLAVDLFHERFGMSFSPALSREFRPYKPDPGPLLHICSTWGVEPNEVMMIGDSLKDDVACGKRAGAFACLLDETGRYDSPEYANVEHKPDYKVSSLAQVQSLLEADFDLTP